VSQARPQHSFLFRNGLAIFSLGFFLIFLVGQAVTGWHEYNDRLADAGQPGIALFAYLLTGNFVEVTFENWESEFLQMFIYVVATIWLRQAGSAESKALEGDEDVDREPKASPDAPWPVRRGGLVLAIYKRSLSIAFALLFVMSFWLHARGSYADYRAEQAMDGKLAEGFLAYLGDSRLWFESFQNWQSEFLSVAAIVLLSVYLRQQGSPESKPVDTPNSETP
jgi:hypothetical protein